MKTSLSIHASKKSSVSVGLNSLGNFCWIQLSSSSSSQPLISSIVGSYAVDFSPSTGELGSFLKIGPKKALMGDDAMVGSFAADSPPSTGELGSFSLEFAVLMADDRTVGCKD